MNNEKRFSSDNDWPICRFGPGGNFINDWPYRKTSKASRQPIGSVLKTIATMLDDVITEELLHSSTIEKISLAIQNADMEEKIDNDKSDKFDASPIAGTEANRMLQKEPMLFDNISGACGPTGYKSANSIRAYRRSKRKRPAFGQTWQGSLFDSHEQSAKVA